MFWGLNIIANNTLIYDIACPIQREVRRNRAKSGATERSAESGILFRFFPAQPLFECQAKTYVTTRHKAVPDKSR
jgi:hypothetical protein